MLDMINKILYLIIKQYPNAEYEIPFFDKNQQIPTIQFFELRIFKYLVNFNFLMGDLYLFSKEIFKFT